MVTFLCRDPPVIVCVHGVQRNPFNSLDVVFTFVICGISVVMFWS